MVRRYGEKNYENKKADKPGPVKAGAKAGMEADGTGTAKKRPRKG